MFLGTDLYQLIETAYQAYQSRVVAHGHHYHRYRDDLLNSIRYTDAHRAIHRNLHSRNIGIMHELLEKRPDLAHEYFYADKFSRHDIKRLLHALNTTTPTEAEKPLPTITQAKTFNCSFSSTQFLILHSYIKKLNLFFTCPTYDEVVALFNCTLSQPLRCTKNRDVAVFFDTISRANLITTTWQDVIGTRGLIHSAYRKNMPLTAHNLTSSLNKFNTQTKMSSAGTRRRQLENSINEMINEILAAGKTNV